MKKIITMLIITGLVACNMPSSVLFADNKKVDFDDSDISSHFVGINDLYKNSLDKENEEKKLESLKNKKSKKSRATADVVNGQQEAAELMRDKMTDRETNFNMAYTGSDLDYVYNNKQEAIETIIANAYSEQYATSPYHGDYLEWCYRSYSADTVDYKDSNGNLVYVIFVITFAFYTDASEEAEVESFVEDSCSDLNLYGDDLTPMQKVVKIQDLVCENATYDYDAYNSGGPDVYPHAFTAYGIVHDNKAVCQGYATLTYALCKEGGIPVRIMTSLSHAWDIVSIDGGTKYYNIDTTWDDSGNNPGTHNYFMKSDADLQRDNSVHVRAFGCATQEFMEEYPVPEDSLVVYECDTEKHTGYCPYLDGDVLSEAETHTFAEGSDVCSVCGYERTVDDNVLNTKYQTDDANAPTAIRFLSTVDSLDYRQVGFIISGTYGDATISERRIVIKRVYSSIIAAGETVYPNTFSENSAYFFTYTVRGMSGSTSSTWNIKSFLVKNDGTTVYGKQKQIKIG